jgi:prepilin-type N-terminal cleavage/methylation domain-containing protein
MPDNNVSTNSGFTLIELLVVISIVSLLSSAVLTSLDDAREQVRNSKRHRDLKQIRTALELYRQDNSQYPKTFSTKFEGTNGYGNTVQWVAPSECKNKSWTANFQEEWVPGLVSGDYINSLPTGAYGGESEVKDFRSDYGDCYRYASNGNEYIVTTWAAVENGPQYGTYYRRLGPREAGNGYLCNHTNIGGNETGNYEPKEDYYAHSYTISNIEDCNETPPPGAPE